MGSTRPLRGHQGTGVVVTEVSDPVEDTRGGTTTGVTSRGEVIERGVTEAGEVTEMVVTREAAMAVTREVATVVTITAEATDMVMTTGVRDKNVVYCKIYLWSSTVNKKG